MAGKNTISSLLHDRIFLTRGVGKSSQRLTSFEMALRDAGIAGYNLVMVSSIFPSGCKLISRSSGEKYLRVGEIVYCVMARMDTDEPHRLVSASIGVAIPGNPGRYGYLSEHHAYGINKCQAGEYAEDLAAQMLATTLGVPFDPEKDYDERKEQYRVGGEIVTTRNITQSAQGDKNGLWTTVIAAAVLVKSKP